MKRECSKAAMRMRALRSWFEGAEASIELLVQASGLKPNTLQDRIRREGWQAFRPGPAAEMDARIARLLASLVRDLDAIEAESAGARPDKGEIDALVARMRLLEKLSEINEGRQGRQEEQKKTDAEIAEILGRIDARIIELAREFAAQLVGDRDTEAAGRAH